MIDAANRKRFVRTAANAVLGRLMRGSDHHCPVCDSGVRRFLSLGRDARGSARCPACSSLDRHRLTVVEMERRPERYEVTEGLFVHIAPEHCLEPYFRRRYGAAYVSGDLMNPRADRVIDLTDIDLPDASVGGFYCSHVLEHIEDDRRALGEIKRVLAPGGWAVLNVPITAVTTLEDPSVVTPKDRLAVFGQADHVRRYGRDYVDRVAESGFSVEELDPRAIVADESERRRLGLSPDAGSFFRCTPRTVGDTGFEPVTSAV